MLKLPAGSFWFRSFRVVHDMVCRENVSGGTADMVAATPFAFPPFQAPTDMFTHISEHARLEIPMDLRDLRVFSPPRPASGKGGRGVRGRALTW